MNNKETKLKDFSDLEFRPHSNGGGIQAYLDFGPKDKKGYRFSISVVANKNGQGSHYGNVEDGEYEVGMFHHGAWIPLALGDDVLARQSSAQISKHMRDAQLNDFAWVCLLHNLRNDHRKELGLDN